MNILSATEAPVPLSTLIVPLMLGSGAATAAAIGLFRRKSIVGPSRIEKDEPLEPLVISMGVGMMVYFLGVAFGGIGGGATTQPATEPVITETGQLVNLVSLVAGDLVMFIVLILLYRGIRRLGMSPDRLPRGIVSGLVGLLIVVPVMILAMAATLKMLNPQEEHLHPSLKLLTTTQDEAGRDVIMVSILAAAPVSEEFFFRACLQTLLGGWVARMKPLWPDARARWMAVIFTSLIFALAHGLPWEMPPIFVLSLCLGYAYERTGNIWTSITIHAAFNGWQLWMFQYLK